MSKLSHVAKGERTIIITSPGNLLSIHLFVYQSQHLVMEERTAKSTDRMCRVVALRVLLPSKDAPLEVARAITATRGTFCFFERVA